jgi:hypothetical protein
MIHILDTNYNKYALVYICASTPLWALEELMILTRTSSYKLDAKTQEKYDKIVSEKALNKIDIEVNYLFKKRFNMWRPWEIDN